MNIFMFRFMFIINLNIVWKKWFLIYYIPNPLKCYTKSKHIV